MANPHNEVQKAQCPPQPKTAKEISIVKKKKNKSKKYKTALSLHRDMKCGLRSNKNKKKLIILTKIN